RRSRRSIRLGGVALALAILVFAVFQTLAWNENRRDLARRAAWTLSSNYPVAGCRSPAQICTESPNYFFHTLQEKNPSVTFDLRSKKGISTVVVENRLDCCPERAVPLVVSVSDDQKRWKEVARRRDTFTSWRAKFPRLRARYVRVHAEGEAMILHLSRVRILP
ncbi:MAG TPA: discoidin domain-containing protein, partial [Polyangiaceae bacterium]|nr:discoidin domain-containing protein [Polyangiaceae bacterium]